MHCVEMRSPRYFWDQCHPRQLMEQSFEIDRWGIKPPFVRRVRETRLNNKLKLNAKDTGVNYSLDKL